MRSLLPTTASASTPLLNQVDGGTQSEAEEVKDAFSKFFGQTFFGQMIKAMRATQQEPAYFHGGQGEKVFQSQFDQTIGEYMTEASADQLSDPLFKRQFPKLAEQLYEAEIAQAETRVESIPTLRRL